MPRVSSESYTHCHICPAGTVVEYEELTVSLKDCESIVANEDEMVELMVVLPPAPRTSQPASTEAVIADPTVLVVEVE